MKRPVTLFAAAIAGMAGFGWTLATYKAPAAAIGAADWQDAANYDQSPNHWSGRSMVAPAQRIPELKSYLDDHPGDARVWHRLGLAQQQASDQTGAQESWARAAEAQASAPPEKSRDLQLYNLACYRALAGDRDGALAAWAECVDAGWADTQTADDDSDLDSIREDPRFVEASRKIVPRPAGTVLFDGG